MDLRLPEAQGVTLWFYCHKTPWLSVVNKKSPPAAISLFIFLSLSTSAAHPFMNMFFPRRGITPYDTQTCCLILSWFGRRLNRHWCPMSKPEKQWPLSNTLRENVTLVTPWIFTRQDILPNVSTATLVLFCMEQNPDSNPAFPDV